MYSDTQNRKDNRCKKVINKLKQWTTKSFTRSKCKYELEFLIGATGTDCVIIRAEPIRDVSMNLSIVTENTFFKMQ